MNYPGWQIQRQQVSPAQALYFRVQAGPRGGWELHHVGDEPRSGSLDVQLVLAGPAGGSVIPLELSVAGQPSEQLQMPVGQQVQYRIPFHDLPPGVHSIQWQVPRARSQDVHLILIDAAVSVNLTSDS